jgi:hypothetical protein
MASIYSFILVAAKYITCLLDKHADYCHTEPSQHLFIIFLVVEGVLFGLFTLCMLGDQWTTISMNQTQIDRLKNTKYEYQNEMNEVCGSASNINFHYSWFVPLPVRFSDEWKTKIYGFVCEEKDDEYDDDEVYLKVSGKEGAESGKNGIAMNSLTTQDEEISPLIKSSNDSGKRLEKKKSPRRVRKIIKIVINCRCSFCFSF